MATAGDVQQLPPAAERPSGADTNKEPHYLLSCHRIALDFGPLAAERALALFRELEPRNLR